MCSIFLDGCWQHCVGTTFWLIFDHPASKHCQVPGTIHPNPSRSATCVAEQERFNFNNLPSRPRREREVVLYSFSSNHSTPPSLQGSETCKLSFLSTAVTLEATVLSVDYFSTMPRRLGQRDCPMKVRIMIADMRGVHSIPEISRAVGLSVSNFFP